MGHKRGESREQVTLFPIMLDELVGEDALVRVIDAWIESLDMQGLGFQKSQANWMGRPPYAPADLLKLYLCGYLNAIRSSRALERECKRNVEVMWLLGRLAPDHKTIANFRSQNSEALVAVCAAFIQFARREQLITGALVAIDGSKIRAVASKKAICDANDLGQEHSLIQAQIGNYLSQLDQSDEQERANLLKGDIGKTLKKLALRDQDVSQELQRLSQGEGKLSVATEPQSQVMKSLHGAPGYNLQSAVDTESHLIVHHEVCRDASDLKQLMPIAQGCVRVLQSKPQFIADAGYANAEQLKAMDEAGLISYVAPSRAINSQAGGGLFDRTCFSYDQAQDMFTCPADKLLKRKQASKHDKNVIYAANPQDCAVCPKKSQCTQAKQRFVSRHQYEDTLQASALRVAQSPQMMRIRRSTVEHPFGTIKHQILGNARLLVRGLKGAKAELSLAVMAYNFKRVRNMKGCDWMMSALRA
jgi:transposase